MVAMAELDEVAPGTDAPGPEHRAHAGESGPVAGVVPIPRLDQLVVPGAGTNGHDADNGRTGAGVPAVHGTDANEDATGVHGSITAAVQDALHLHLRDHLAKIEHLVGGTAERAIRTGEKAVPAWLRPTPGEKRWPVTLTVLAAVGLQLVVPERLVVHPVWLLPGIELVLLALLIVANPSRINRDHRLVRLGSLTLVTVATFANVWTAVHLIDGLINATEKEDAAHLLAYGAAIWATNVIVFALWYWEFDRGGPVARAKATRPHPDFQFAQMQTPDLSHEHWEPAFFDYLYLSFTNATAFSPTDTLPLSRWAKMAMLAQSCVSLATVALVVARAVNILG
jgi:uncharacterized membrane protein